MNWLAILSGMALIGLVFALRFLPFLVITYIVIHFLIKWW
jgi:hypothetical protein